MSTSLEVHRIDNYTIPDRYGTSELHLLSKDPDWVFAYWEVTQAQRSKFLDILSSEAREKSCWKLKLNNLSNRTFGFHDVDIDTPSWYINTRCPDSLVSADLGLYLPDGIFLPVLSSNIVYTSRNVVSNILNTYYINIFDMVKEGRKKHNFMEFGTCPVSTSGSEAYFGISSYNLFN